MSLTIHKVVCVRKQAYLHLLVYPDRMGSTDDDIAAELRDSQAAVLTIDAIRRRRQRAVTAALNAGWTKYRVAAELGVAAPTVDSIIKAARGDAE